MKKTIVGFISIFFLVFCVSAQNKEARKIDEISSFCCEDVRIRLNTFLLELQNNPKAKGYFIFYGGKSHPVCNTNRTPKRGEIDIISTIFKNHVKFRNQDLGRVVWIDGGYRENWTAEFWIVPNDADAPKPTPTVKEKEIKFKRGKAKKLDLRCEP